jgi:hypothetical protein
MRYTGIVPTVLRVDGYRFFFYSSDRVEPIHIHVERAGATAKVWLRPARLDRSHGFSNAEIATILRHVDENNKLIERSWYEFFSD